MIIGLVGGGLFGRIVGTHLRSLGHSVSIFDAGHAEAGIRAAGCLIKPSWTSSVPMRSAGLELLHRLFGIRTVPFSVINKRVTVDDVWVLNKSALSQVEVIKALVVNWSRTEIQIKDGSTFEFDIVISCVGGWGTRQRPRYGLSRYSRGITNPRIEPWRPFNQMVKFNIERELIWSGEGTAVIDIGKHITSIRSRLDRFAGSGEDVIGRRPYSIIKSAFPADIYSGSGGIDVTGGAKNGTIGAAWAALQIGEMLPR